MSSGSHAAGAAACYVIVEDGILLDVRVTTRAARDGVDGTGALADGRMVAHIRVRAVPADGAANKAVRATVAKALGRPKSTVELVAGATSRLKRLRISGVPSELTAVVRGWPARPG